MDISAASFAFSALSQPVRLDVFRLLVSAGPNGLAAGDIADALAVKQNTMSANLAVLQRAGLISSARAGRSIIYRADMTAMSGLIGFMLQDCCGGKPELCAPALQSVINQTPKSEILCEC
jgi:ArsR family transcriptional regulator, arsenate/arsenite/antimonite-responsive transcriptional repressor